MKKIFYTILLTTFCLFFIYSPAKATNEKITNFHSDITIQKDASIIIEETIDYYFDSQKHGIFRYVPYKYKNADDKKFETMTEILEISCDNHAEEYFVSNSGNNKKIKIGDPDKTISGNHQYKIKYKVLGVINYFEKHDEFYWNVSGFDWEALIEKQSAVVHLPQEVNQEKIQATCYSGEAGSTSQNCNKSISSDKSVNFSSTDYLTIVVGWNKGVVSVIDRQFVTDWREIFKSPFWFLTFFAGLGFLIWYYYKFGRDPGAKRAITPEFEISKTMSPQVAGAVVDERINQNECTAIMVNLAVKKYLKIIEKDKKIYFEKTKDLENSEPEEEKIFNFIFEQGNKVSVDDLKKQARKRNKAIFTEVATDLYKKLTETDKLFNKNPNSARAIFMLFAILFFIIAEPLFLLGNYLAWAVILIGVATFIFAFFAPTKRTLKGVDFYYKARGYKYFIEKAEKYRSQWEEKENIFSKVLPYAIAYGITKKWVNQFKKLNTSDLYWYNSDRDIFRSYIFYNSINNLNKSFTSASVQSQAASGGSGFSGGSSGGGFGGGGGGSW